jgi:phage/plasmid-associated DNA primase
MSVYRINNITLNDCHLKLAYRFIISGRKDDFNDLFYEIYKNSVQKIHNFKWFGCVGNKWQVMSTDEMINNVQSFLSIYAGHLHLRYDSKRISIMPCSESFDNKFVTIVDRNKNLVGFKNGTYDLKHGIFRDMIPTDMISKTVGYDYKCYDYDDPIINDINEFFTKLYPDEQLKEYAMIVLASTFRGQVDGLIHLQVNGPETNELMVRLIKKMLGEYCKVHDIRDIRGADYHKRFVPDNLGKRLLIFHESESVIACHNKNKYIRTGLLKDMISRDPMNAKPYLYGDIVTYIPINKIMLFCQQPINFNTNDSGTWQRLKYINNLNQSSDSNQSSDQNLQLYESKIYKWYQAITWLILDKYYPIYKNNDYMVIEPVIMYESKTNYRDESHFITRFFKDELICTGDSNDRLPISEVYGIFKHWYGTYYNDRCSVKDFRYHCTERNMIQNDAIHQYAVKGG